MSGEAAGGRRATIQSLERGALTGVLVGLACVLIDAFLHRGGRLLGLVGLARTMRPPVDVVSFVMVMCRARPLLALGLTLIAGSMLITLGVSVATFGRTLDEHRT